LAEDAGKASIEHGEVLHTGPDGHALVSVRDTLWRLQGLSAVRLEGISQPTMRLASGRLECRGAGRCLTEFGVVVGQEDSMWSMEMAGDGLGLQIAEGEATFLSAKGETPMRAGEVWFVDAHGTPTQQ
ncbi:MAG: hypothetical protein P1V35_10445, partial [Planctomycetota bacterium]|nr:hypothetical protein [Planctomycetota bacterium]